MMANLFYYVITRIIWILLWVYDLFDSIFHVLLIKLNLLSLNCVLSKFSIVEEDSAWHLEDYYKNNFKELPNDKKNEIIDQILEEREHADMLKIKSKTNFSFPQLPYRTDLGLSSELLPYFIRIGEEAALQKYILLRRFIHIPQVEKIIIDEQKHMENITDGKVNMSLYFRALFKYFSIFLETNLLKVLKLIYRLATIFIYYIPFTLLSFPLKFWRVKK